VVFLPKNYRAFPPPPPPAGQHAMAEMSCYGSIFSLGVAAKTRRILSTFLMTIDIVKSNRRLAPSVVIIRR
jgi:hypothetical protein